MPYSKPVHKVYGQGTVSGPYSSTEVLVPSLISCAFFVHRMGIKAPGKLLLLLATAAIALQHGAATTSSTTSLSCGVEFQNCQEDKECDECGSSTENSDAYLDCRSTAAEGTSCASISVGTCCRAEASDHDCLGNENFVAYHTCIMNSLLEECTALDCSALGGNQDGGISDTRTSDTDDAADDGGDTIGADDDMDDAADDDGGETTGVDDDVDTTGASGADDYAVLGDTDGQCPVEAQACFDDEGCLECVALADFDSDEWVECWGQYTIDGSDVCPYYTSSIICCLDAQSPSDCAGNTAFVALYLCMSSELSLSLGQGECTTFTCSDGQAIDSSGDGVVGDTEDGADASGADASGAAGIGVSPSLVVLTLVWCIFVLL